MKAEEAYKILEKQGFTATVYGKYQVNATDKAGIIHSLYPTTGTIVLHDRVGNVLNADYPKTVTIKNASIFYFIKLLNHPELVQMKFKHRKEQ